MNNSKNSSDLRRTLAQFATGVTVVSCMDAANEPLGITANSFTSVSLDPPMILWNIDSRSGSWDTYLQASHFSINILNAEQQDLAKHFAQSKAGLFKDIDYTTSRHGTVEINDVLAVLHCQTLAIHEYGDHHIIIGEVLEHWYSEKQALIFLDGQFKANKS